MLFAEADLEIGFDTLGWNEDQDPEYFGSQRTFAAYDVSADIIFKKKMSDYVSGKFIKS